MKKKTIVVDNLAVKMKHLIGAESNIKLKELLVFISV
jgi:hypothetical protein